MLSVKWWASTGLAKKHITLTNCLVPQACLGNVYHSGQFVSFFCCNWSQYAKRTWGERRQPSWPCEHYRFPSVCMALGTVATQYVAHHTSYSCVNDINVSINVNASLQLAIQSPQFLTFMNVSLTMTIWWASYLLEQRAAYLSVFGPMSWKCFTIYRVCLDNIPTIWRGSSHPCAS